VVDHGCIDRLKVQNRIDLLGVEIGGPSLIIAPDGDVLVETIEPLTLATLDRETVAEARKSYPGYLDVRADLYGRIWGSLS